MMIIVFVLFAEHTLIPNMWSYFVVKPKFYFEDFKTDQEMQAYFEKEYPVGSSVRKLLSDAEDAGASCEAIANAERTKSSEYYDKYYCLYRTFFFSRNPAKVYIILSYTSKDYIITSVDTTFYGAQWFVI